MVLVFGNTMQRSLQELCKYHFSSVPEESLSEHPYQTYTQMYCYLSENLKFFEGYVRPSPVLKAKIYRAIHLAGDGHAKNFLIFASKEGLTIKHGQILDENFKEAYQRYIQDHDKCVFIPKGCAELQLNEFPYYRKLLLDFAKNLQIDGSVLTFSEYDPDFIFLSCVDPPAVNLEQKWNEYLNGGLIRSWSLALDSIYSALFILSWCERSHYQIDDKTITIFGKCNSLKEWQRKTTKIEASEKEYILYNLPEQIRSQEQAFGILRALDQAGISVKDICPLIQTQAILIPKDLLDFVEEALQSFDSGLKPPMDEVEIFTQTCFNQMNNFEIAALIQAPSGNYYSYLHLIESSSNRDPITRESYSEKFQKELQQIQERFSGIFLTDFPQPPFDPEFSIEEDAGCLKLILTYLNDRYCFWRIPDFRNTEYAAISLHALQVIVVKWSSRVLFKGSPPSVGMNLALIFHPVAYSVFEDQVLLENSSQASQKLQTQTAILESIY